MRGGLWQLGHSITRRLAQTDKRTIARRCYASDAELKKTALYDFHVAHGGKMVPFAGWSMPIQYKDSIMDSTVNCRENGSLFDVAHMCGLSLKGKDCIPFLEKLVIADVAGLAPGTGTLTVFTNEKGGAIDDSVITKVTDTHIYLVVNAGCRDKDLAHIEEHMKAFTSKGGDVSWHIHDERSLLALQGPLAAPVLQHLTKFDLSKFYFGEFQMIDINGVHCYLTRTGYTGEDGFEISVPSEHAVDLAKAMLEKSEGKVRLTGLGARDSLRLEAGLCLYGNDMEQHISPVEAGLTWAVGKRRRAEGGFLGADVILKQIADGPTIRRVGFLSAGPPPRGHSEIQDENGQNIGEITSGGFSPCLKKNIAMGYVKSGNHKAGTNSSASSSSSPERYLCYNMPRTSEMPKWVEDYVDQIGSVLREGGWGESDISEIVHISPSGFFDGDMIMLDNEAVLDVLLLKADRFSDSLRKAGWSSEEVSDALGFDFKPEKEKRPAKNLSPELVMKLGLLAESVNKSSAS